MARLTDLPTINPIERTRHPYTFLDATSVTSSWTSGHFETHNITGAIVWVKAVSTAGTPNYTLGVQTSHDETAANFVTITPSAAPAIAAINDEVAHVYSLNLNNCHRFTRFVLTLNGGDRGDDVVTMKVIFLYGSMTHPTDVVLETGDLEIGAVELKNASTDDRASVSDASTARAATDHVLLTQPLDAAGNVLGRTAANTARTTGTLVDPVQVIDAAGNVIGVDAANTARTTATKVLPTQSVDAAGVVGAVQGGTAHDAADAGNPLKIGGKAASSKPAAVTAGDRVDAYFDLYGRQHVYDEGGGGVSGGGFSTYTFTPTNSLGDGTSAYVAATQFSVSGHSFTPEAVALVKVDRFNAAGAFQETISPSQSTVTASTTAGVTTYTVAGASFTAGDLFVVYQGGPERTVSKSTDSQRTEEISPLNQQVVEESLVDTTNVAVATNYYPSADGISMLGYKSLSLSGKFIDADGTMTLNLEVTNDEDATASNRDWISAGLSSIDQKTGIQTIAAALTVTNGTLTFGIKWADLNFKYARVIMVNDGATNTAIIKARRCSI